VMGRTINSKTSMTSSFCPIAVHCNKSFLQALCIS
jgi:hypothetical protein